MTIVAELVQRRVVQEGAGGWELTTSPQAVTVGVPENLRQVIEQQFERLTPPEQAIVEAASVAGVDFAAAAVAASLGEASDVIDARCATLARQGQFVQAHGTGVWPDGTVAGHYRFCHALYQDVVYARIPAGRRAHLHRQIGRRLEAGYGPQTSEIATELAEHFVRGHEVPQALHYLQQAAETAAQRYAPHAVIDLVQRALVLLRTQPETLARTQQEIDLHLALGPAWATTKGTTAPEVEHTYARALALCQEIGETPQLFPTLRGLSWFYRARGMLSAAREVEAQLYELAQRAANPTTSWKPMVRSGTPYYSKENMPWPERTWNRASPLPTRRCSAPRRCAMELRLGCGAAPQRPGCCGV
jgi:predicted ATPase